MKFFKAGVHWCGGRGQLSVVTLGLYAREGSIFFYVCSLFCFLDSFQNVIDICSALDHATVGELGVVRCLLHVYKHLVAPIV